VRVAVIGATGRIGTNTVHALQRRGHEAVPISRSSGVDAHAGSGLDAALHGVDVVIDTSNPRSQDEAEIVDFFGTITANLLAAEQRAGVRHHVLLSIVGIEKGQRVPHYEGKREQERLVRSGSIPWSVVRSTKPLRSPSMAGLAAAVLASATGVIKHPRTRVLAARLVSPSI
jgi:uncharacterized protein YbjT (DUF2867 family)